MPFTFKEFTVDDSGVAMKVGTDGVLLGAWASTTNARALDIGTGSGLIALMLAQRCPNATIDAIDIEPNAVKQAAENFAASSWANRLRAINADINTFYEKAYHLIVANPPFFSKSLPAPDTQRQHARHDDTLTLEQLFTAAQRLIANDGRFALILPEERRLFAAAIANKTGFSLARATTVFTRQNSKPKRVLLEFSSSNCKIEQADTIAIYDNTGQYSLAYQSLCRQFYLHF